jgi:hypothetical protein
MLRTATRFRAARLDQTRVRIYSQHRFNIEDTRRLRRILIGRILDYSLVTVQKWPM